MEPLNGRVPLTAHHDWEALYAESGAALPWEIEGRSRCSPPLVEREPLGEQVLNTGAVRVYVFRAFLGGSAATWFNALLTHSAGL